MKLMAKLLFGLAYLSASCSSSPDTVPTELIGSWQGDGKIIVTWCEQERLPVALEIAADAAVSGTVGDARIVDGRLRHNRGELGRALEVKTDWIVVGDLEGPLIAAEDIHRDGVKLPLNLHEGTLEGGVHSTGTHVGDKDTMVLTAAQVVLRRELTRFRVPLLEATS